MAIFTGNLFEGVYGDKELKEQAISFLRRGSDVKLRIAFQYKDDKDRIVDKSFLKAILSDARRKGAVEVFDASHIPQEISNHFTLMDGEAFRYEMDHSKGTAIANFGDKSVASRLANVFDNIILKSKKVFSV